MGTHCNSIPFFNITRPNLVAQCLHWLLKGACLWGQLLEFLGCMLLACHFISRLKCKLICYAFSNLKDSVEIRIYKKKSGTCNGICIEVASDIVSTTVVLVQDATSPVYASVHKRRKVLVAINNGTSTAPRDRRSANHNAILLGKWKNGSPQKDTTMPHYCLSHKFSTTKWNLEPFGLTWKMFQKVFLLPMQSPHLCSLLNILVWDVDPVECDICEQILVLVHGPLNWVCTTIC